MAKNPSSYILMKVDEVQKLKSKAKIVDDPIVKELERFKNKLSMTAERTDLNKKDKEKLLTEQLLLITKELRDYGANALNAIMLSEPTEHSIVEQTKEPTSEHVIEQENGEDTKVNNEQQTKASNEEGLVEFWQNFYDKDAAPVFVRRSKRLIKK